MSKHNLEFRAAVQTVCVVPGPGSPKTSNPTDTEFLNPNKLENGSCDDEEKDRHDPYKRDNWGRGVEFLFSCIAMSVGLGNLWRFPFVAWKNGGGK